MYHSYNSTFTKNYVVFLINGFPPPPYTLSRLSWMRARTMSLFTPEQEEMKGSQEVTTVFQVRSHDSLLEKGGSQEVGMDLIVI